MVHDLVERQAADGRPGGKGAEQPRWKAGRQHDELPEIVGAADQAAERLPDARPDDTVVIGAAALRRAPRRMENGGTRPRYPLHDHEPQRFTRHIDPVAERIGAEQRGVRIGTEDVDEGAGVERIDMLGIERQSGAREAVSDAGVDDAQPADRAEQAERTATRRLDQAAVCAGEAGRSPRAISVTISTSACRA